MYDFRTYKNKIKEAVKEVNETANWKWTARIDKGEIKLTNDYIKGDFTGDDLNDYFSITCSNGSIKGRDCFHETFACEIIGDEYDDGPIESCIEKAIRNAEGFFNNRY